VGDHTCREKSSNDAPPEPALSGKELVLMIGIKVTGNTAEECDISLGKGTPVGERLAQLKRVESFAQALLERCGRI
jgi:hypothetical protein